MKISHSIKRQKGFTLVETLIAISIFSVSVLAVVSLLGNDIAHIRYAKKKMTASYLAQEGIEYFRNIRDTYALFDSGGAQAGWDAFLLKLSPCDATSNPSKKCYFRNENLFNGGGSVIDLALPSCGSGSCPVLNVSPGGEYSYDPAGEDSGFIREIKTVNISSSEVKIFSTVYWTQESGSYSMTFTENLYNWIQ